MTSTASVVIWGIWIVVILRFYHKMFDVYYFRGSALFKELFFAALLGMVMTGLTLYFWWLTAIIIILCGLVISKKTSNSAALIGCIILAVVISVIGIKARKEMREDAESQNIDDLTETYSDDMFTDINDLIKNDMEEDTMNSDSWDDANSQEFENEEIPEYLSTGQIFFKGVPIDTFFHLRRVDVYDEFGLSAEELKSDTRLYTSELGVVDTIEILNVSDLTIDGIGLNTNREGLAALLGEPSSEENYSSGHYIYYQFPDYSICFELPEMDGDVWKVIISASN